jgi:hypothetical protein
MIPTVKVELSLAEKLAGLTCDAVLYDEQGRALGYFSPMEEPTRLDEMQLEPPFSIAEMEATRKKYEGMRPEDVGKPLKEILSRYGF